MRTSETWIGNSSPDFSTDSNFCKNPTGLAVWTRQLAGLVGYRSGHGDAEHGDHRARQRAAALVTDTSADPPARDVRGVTLDRGRGDEACGLRLRW